MADDSSRGGWLRGLSAGSGRKSDETSPRIGKPLSVAVAEKAPAGTQPVPTRASRGLAFLVAGEPAGFTGPAVERLEPEADQQLLARYLKWLELMRAATGD